MTGPVHTGSSYRLAVSAEMVFVDLLFEDRVRRIADAGFEVEIWDWTKKDIAALAKTGATFSSMIGCSTGTLADPDGAAPGSRSWESGPGTGEISYPAIATALHRLGYTGVVGLEAWASGDPELALQRFRTAFTVN